MHDPIALIFCPPAQGGGVKKIDKPIFSLFADDFIIAQAQFFAAFLLPKKSRREVFLLHNGKTLYPVTARHKNRPCGAKNSIPLKEEIELTKLTLFVRFVNSMLEKAGARRRVM
ncbi:MAG: hypothetical protein LBH06_06515 [Rikenellaceae bacterium]|nr:hypothetical protein [Rikenellaceae bacterium]